jgi:hypothetical protein
MRYVIERRGGLAGLRASGTVDGNDLNPADREELERLLTTEGPLAQSGADRYTYLVTRHAASGTTTREIPEGVLPEAVANAVAVEI